VKATRRGNEQLTKLRGTAQRARKQHAAKQDSRLAYLQEADAGPAVWADKHELRAWQNYRNCALGYDLKAMILEAN